MGDAAPASAGYEQVASYGTRLVYWIMLMVLFVVDLVALWIMVREFLCRADSRLRRFVFVPFRLVILADVLHVFVYLATTLYALVRSSYDPNYYLGQGDVCRVMGFPILLVLTANMTGITIVWVFLHNTINICMKQPGGTHDASRLAPLVWSSLVCCAIALAWYLFAFSTGSLGSIDGLYCFLVPNAAQASVRRSTSTLLCCSEIR
jgi:hypothetical protein